MAHYPNALIECIPFNQKLQLWIWNFEYRCRSEPFLERLKSLLSLRVPLKECLGGGERMERCGNRTDGVLSWVHFNLVSSDDVTQEGDSSRIKLTLFIFGV